MPKLDLEQVLDALPSNWLDPILTGPDAIPCNGPNGFYAPRDVELIIQAIRKRIAALPVTEN